MSEFPYSVVLSMTKERKFVSTFPSSRGDKIFDVT